MPTSFIMPAMGTPAALASDCGNAPAEHQHAVQPSTGTRKTPSLNSQRMPRPNC